MYQQEYYVPKSSGTLADPLLAYGLATVLDALVKGVPGRGRHRRYGVTIEDRGLYVIRLPEPIREEWISAVKIAPSLLALPVVRVAKPKPLKAGDATAGKPKPEKRTLPSDLPFIDYNAVWDEIRKERALIDEHVKQRGSITRQELQELKESFKVQPDRDVALLIGDYRMQVESIHNQAVLQWYTTTTAGYQAANLRAILTLFASPAGDVETVAKTWAKEVKLDGVQPHLTASQVYNPSMGKGQNRAKADRLSMGNEKNFWLVEYLKAVGLFKASLPRAFSDEGMRKTYVLAPARVNLDDHDTIFDRFKRNLSGLGVSPIKADILTSLDYASAYLSYWAEAKRDPDEPLGRQPDLSIHGFNVASYMLLSQNSFTTINLSFLGLPPWISGIVSADDILTLQEVIEEQRAIVRPLREKFQETNHLLDSYRDFLSGHRTQAFFDFCAGYGEYVVRTIPENSRIKQIGITSLDEIFRRIGMAEQGTVATDDLTEFISTAGKHEGFHRIAYAIRQSTVMPQRAKARAKGEAPGAKSPFEVRYGLGNSLRRKTDSRRDFMVALAEFVQLYNAETEQEYENAAKEHGQDVEAPRRYFRKLVNVEDLDDVLDLVQKYDAQLVCNMLLAYGYATNRRKEAADASGSDETVIERDEQ